MLCIELTNHPWKVTNEISIFHMKNIRRNKKILSLKSNIGNRGNYAIAFLFHSDISRFKVVLKIIQRLWIGSMTRWFIYFLWKCVLVFPGIACVDCLEFGIG